VTNKTIDPIDNLMADIVGPWAIEKHERLRKYIDAYRSARAKFLPPKGTGGAAYIDLFSGPGRSQIEDSGEFIDGSPIVAYKAAQISGTRFSDLHFNDLDQENVDVLRQRIARLGGMANYYNETAELAVDQTRRGCISLFLILTILKTCRSRSSQSLPSCKGWTC
jgi:three-Cys-motif partner protein